LVLLGLNIECAVRPPGNNVAAIPDDAKKTLLTSFSRSIDEKEFTIVAKNCIQYQIHISVN